MARMLRGTEDGRSPRLLSILYPWKDMSKEYTVKMLDWDDRDDLDYDLTACLRYNPQDGLTPMTVDRVLAVTEGENDGEDWRWVVALRDGRFAYIQGGCDFTGWDCISYAWSVIDQTAGDAAGSAQPEAAVATLRNQLANGKKQTWREAKDRELGVTSG